MPFKSACVVAGIGVTTLNEWRKLHLDLETHLAEARELARLKALQAIKAAGERDWRAHAEWLKLVFADDYRGSTKIDVSATAVASPPVMSEERRMELIERRRQLAWDQSQTRFKAPREKFTFFSGAENVHHGQFGRIYETITEICVNYLLCGSCAFEYEGCDNSRDGRHA